MALTDRHGQTQATVDIDDLSCHAPEELLLTHQSSENYCGTGQYAPQPDRAASISRYADERDRGMADACHRRRLAIRHGHPGFSAMRPEETSDAQ
jgi:hypothetical protein